MSLKLNNTVWLYIKYRYLIIQRTEVMLTDISNYSYMYLHGFKTKIPFKSMIYLAI